MKGVKIRCFVFISSAAVEIGSERETNRIQSSFFSDHFRAVHILLSLPLALLAVGYLNDPLMFSSPLRACFKFFFFFCISSD